MSDKITCLNCRAEMKYLGRIPFRLGGMEGVASIFLGGAADTTERVAEIDVYRCTNCRRLELVDINLNL